MTGMAVNLSCAFWAAHARSLLLQVCVWKLAYLTYFFSGNISAYLIACSVCMCLSIALVLLLYTRFNSHSEHLVYFSPSIFTSSNIFHTLDFFGVAILVTFSANNTINYMSDPLERQWFTDRIGHEARIFMKKLVEA